MKSGKLSLQYALILRTFVLTERSYWLWFNVFLVEVV